MKTVEGFLEAAGRKTRYRIVGERGELPPLVTVHAGPGFAFETLTPLEDIAASGRAVVFYDQIGSGSTDSPDARRDWSVEAFVMQLEQLRAALGLDDMHVLGHSWGGMLALEYALAHPARVRSLVLLSTMASVASFMEARARFRAAIPERDLADLLARHEASGKMDDPEFAAARQRFDELYCCRRTPWPDFLRRAVDTANIETGRIMWGPGGVLADWDARPRLGQVTAPTLVVDGKYDGYAPGQAPLLTGGIRNARLVTFQESSHYAHVEEPRAFRDALTRFVAEHDGDR